MKEMLQSYEAMRKMEPIGELGFSMTFYLDTISLEQSNCEMANFVYNGLFNTFQHCSTLFQHSYGVPKGR